jgi:hypothetical protein
VTSIVGVYESELASTNQISAMLTSEMTEHLSMDKGPQLGQLIVDGDRRRDAIHIAVAPVTAAERLTPGQHVGLVQEGSVEMVGPCDNAIGIVDPFLAEEVEAGQRFWLFMYPNTVTSLRHIWTHPIFTAAAAAVKEKVK